MGIIQKEEETEHAKCKEPPNVKHMKKLLS